MPIINSIAEMADEIMAWRHDFHAHPELLYDVHRTSEIVAKRLRAFGCDEVATGVGRTGVVGVIHGRKRCSGRVVGLRADMDALPIQEATGLPYASKTPGVMHACGHDGHTAMLLGAAKYLAETRNFDGTAIFIFQPAEEGGAGGKAMVDDGLMTRWGIQEVYSMHNSPNLPEGHFALRPGAIMASGDLIEITVTGKGGHGGSGPHRAVDSVLVGAAIVTGLQSVVARNVDPMKSAVVSICTFHAGDAFNIIPQNAVLTGTARTLDPEVHELVARRVVEVAEGIAKAYGASATVKYEKLYPVTVNAEKQAAFAASVARDIVGPDRVDDDAAPVMAAEDFSFMLNERPGALIRLGMGGGEPLHHPGYTFNDAIIPKGVSYWVRLVERSMESGGPRTTIGTFCGSFR
jgi:amidohydrolase